MLGSDNTGRNGPATLLFPAPSASRPLAGKERRRARLGQPILSANRSAGRTETVLHRTVFPVDPAGEEGVTRAAVVQAR